MTNKLPQSKLDRPPHLSRYLGEWGYTLVFCDACGTYYDEREVSELPTRRYKIGLQKILFDCPRGHHATSFKVWHSYSAIMAGRAFDEEFLKACGIQVEKLTDIGHQGDDMETPRDSEQEG
jgi:hypothetical protein